MKNSPPFLLALCLLLACPWIAQACRPFGSYGFTEDREGGLWFTEGDNNSVSRLARDGTVTAHPLPTPAAEPSSVALDPLGNVWFAEMNGRRIGRLAPDGRITEYPVPMGQPFQVTVDRQGEVWFTVLGAEGHNTEGHSPAPNRSGIGHLDRSGRLNFHPTPAGWPTAIAFDSLNQAWVTLLLPGEGERSSQGLLLRLSRNGQWQEDKHWPNPSCPRNLVPDQQGGLHFSDGCRHSVSYRDSRGTLREQPLPGQTSIQWLSLAPDGRLWFTDRATLGYLDKDSRPVFLWRPAAGDATMAVQALSNGEVVFSEFYNYNINRRTRDGHFVEHLVGTDRPRTVQESRQGEICMLEFSARIEAKAEMERQRAEEVRRGRFLEDGAGTEKLVAEKCLTCHDARRLLLSRRSDWSSNIGRMHGYRNHQGLTPLSQTERDRLVRYFNTYYGLR